MCRPSCRRIFRRLALAATLGLPFSAVGCSFVEAIEQFDQESPAPELGRPGWVRVASGVGAWSGGLVGGVVAVALLPVTLPARWSRGDSLPADEDLLFPVTMFAGVGHGLLGTPADAIDFAARRAWND